MPHYTRTPANGECRPAGEFFNRMSPAMRAALTQGIRRAANQPTVYDAYPPDDDCPGEDDARPEAPADPGPLAGEPDLVGAVRRDLATLGLVGESDQAVLVWLAYSSRKRKRPVSVIVRGPSGSGKDQIQRVPSRLIPPEDVIDTTSMTPQALYYGEPGWLSNKVVLGGERQHQDDEAARDRTAAVRQMLSNGKVTKRTVQFGKTVTIEQEGPISYSETTTVANVFAEDANRVFMVRTTPDADQTRAVMRVAAAGYAADAPDTTAERAAARAAHHRFQRSLKDVPVAIPFAGFLADRVPAVKVEARRVFGQLLALIETVAWVHQHHRARDAGGKLVATADDYALARSLVLATLRESIGPDLERVKKDVETLSRQPAVFTTKQATDALGCGSRKVVGDRLDRLVGAGVLKQVTPGVGPRPATWRLTGRDPSDDVLPTAEEVRGVPPVTPSVPCVTTRYPRGCNANRLEIPGDGACVTSVTGNEGVGRKGVRCEGVVKGDTWNNERIYTLSLSSPLSPSVRRVGWGPDRWQGGFSGNTGNATLDAWKSLGICVTPPK